MQTRAQYLEKEIRDPQLKQFQLLQDSAARRALSHLDTIDRLRAQGRYRSAQRVTANQAAERLLWHARLEVVAFELAEVTRRRYMRRTACDRPQQVPYTVRFVLPDGSIETYRVKAIYPHVALSIAWRKHLRRIGEYEGGIVPWVSHGTIAYVKMGGSLAVYRTLPLFGVGAPRTKATMSLVAFWWDKRQEDIRPLPLVTPFNREE